MNKATAPGKIILLGEHAVVYGQPALAIPVTQVGVTVQIDLDETSNGETNRSWKDLISVCAPDIDRSGLLSHFPTTKDPISLVIELVMKEMGITIPPKCHIKIESSIPVASGMGSSAASSVALARAFSSILGQELEDGIISRIAFEAEKLHHGTPSGIDNTVITYAKPVFYIKDQKIDTLQVREPFTLIIADSGIRISTAESVGDVRKLWLGEPEKYGSIFSQIGEIVKQGKHAMHDGDIDLLGQLMIRNQSLLEELTVSSPTLERLCEAAFVRGALGAKLSGGGRGGNMIALVCSEEASSVEKALIKAGATKTFISRVE
ncbi:mevalonate kinase [Chloroflexota bacterium]